MDPFPSVQAIEMTDALAEDLKMRCNEFNSHATNIHIFGNSFAVEGSDLQKNCNLN
jgi:hypothetical protein